MNNKDLFRLKHILDCIEYLFARSNKPLCPNFFGRLRRSDGPLFDFFKSAQTNIPSG